MLNKDAGFQSATSLKTKLLYKYFSKLFPKFLEQVLNRTPLRGCCGIKILKLPLLNALSFFKKPLEIWKCLREILDIYISYLFTVPFIVVYLIPTVRWRLKFGLKFKCSGSILRIYWFLVNFTKAMKHERECITYVKSSMLMSMSLLKQPNRAFSLPNVYSISILADENR